MSQSAWNSFFTPTPDYNSAMTVGNMTGVTANLSASFVGNMVENALFPPNLPTKLTGSGAGLTSPISQVRGNGMPAGLVGWNNDGDSSQFYSVSGIRNSARVFGAVRQVFGQWRVAPDIAADPYKLVFGNTEELYCLFDFGYGYVEVSDMRIGNTPISAFKDLSYKVWQNYTNQRPWFYRNDHATDSYDIEIDQNWITRAAPAAVSGSVAFELYFPQGLAKFDKNGQARGENIQFDIQYQKDGGPWRGLKTVPHITWSIPPNIWQPSRISFNQMRTGAFTIWVRLEFQQLSGQYNFRIRRLHKPQHRLAQPVEPHIARVNDEVRLAAISSITMRNPLEFKVPHTVVEFRIYASNQIDGMLDDFTALVKRHIPVWDGKRWETKFSRNPAWVACEILRGKANPNPIPDRRIDLDSFLAWSKWCNQKAAQGDARFTIDANMDSETTVAERLLSVMHSARASLTMRKGKYSVIWEQWPTKATQVFTPANSWGFTAQKVWTRKVDGLKVEWIDPGLDYQQTELIVYADGKNEKNSQYFETISCPYCTRWSQAFRDGRYHLAVGKLRPEIFSLTTDVESLVCERGDLVKVQHDVPMTGGMPSRIVAITGSDVTTREPFLVLPGKNYQLLIRYKDGTSEAISIASQKSTYTATLSKVPVKATVGDLTVFGETNLVTQDFLVKSIVPGAELTAVMTLVPYSPAIKTADTKAIPAYKPPIAKNKWVPGCMASDVTIGAVVRHLNRMPVAIVTVSWKAIAYAALYEVYYSEDDKDYTLVDVVRSTEYVLWNNRHIMSDDYPQNDVYVKVIPVTAYGTKPGVASCKPTKFTPPKDTTAPGKPLFFSGNISGTVMHLSWLPPEDNDVMGYVLRYTPTLTKPLWANGVTERELIPHDAFSVDINVRLGSYMLKTIDTSGNYSADYSVVKTTIPRLDGMNFIVGAREDPDFTGHKMQVVKLGNSIVLDKTGAGPCGAYSYGIYTFDEKHTVDVGSISECYISTDMEVTGDECVYMSDWLPTIADIDPIAATGQDDWDVVVQIRSATKLTAVIADWVPNMAAFDPIAQVGSATDWSGWQTLTAGYYTGRHFQFRAILTSNNDKTWPVISKLGAVIDMPDRIVSEHDLAVPIGGKRFIFPNGAYKNKPAVATTLDNAGPDDLLKISGISEDGFDAEVFDISGPKPASKAGQFDYVARGYGRILTKMNPALDPGTDDNPDLMPEALIRTRNPAIMN